MRNYTDVIKECYAVLKKGGVILTPTDTVPGLSCDPFSEDGIRRIAELKNRPEEKHYVFTVGSEDILHRYVKEIPEHAFDFMEFSSEPLTIIYPGAIGLPPALIADDSTIAIRIVKDGFYGQLLKKWGKALVSTSANLSGQASPTELSQVDKVIVEGVDYVVNIKLPDTPTFKSSQIIKLGIDGEINIIRR